MILVLSGTEDGKEIVKRLHERGDKLITSVATEYGKAIFERMQLGEICIHGRLDKVNLIKLIEDEDINILVDATHPYAINVSINAIEACKEKSIKYIRFQRNASTLPKSHLIHHVDDVNEAINKCNVLSNRIMLTTGFNNLKEFIKLNETKEIVVRVLPIAEHIRKCVEMGIHPSNIVAMQGPFSVELNKSLFNHFKIDTIITKESGKEGGVIEKVQAAIDCGINVVLIKRPELNYPCVYSSIDKVFDNLNEDIR